MILYTGYWTQFNHYNEHRSSFIQSSDSCKRSGCIWHITGNPVDSDDFRNTHRTPQNSTSSSWSPSLLWTSDIRFLTDLHRSKVIEVRFLVGTISSSPEGIHHFLMLTRGYLLSMVCSNSLRGVFGMIPAFQHCTYRCHCLSRPFRTWSFSTFPDPVLFPSSWERDFNLLHTSSSVLWIGRETPIPLSTCFVRYPFWTWALS